MSDPESNPPTARQVAARAVLLKFQIGLAAATPPAEMLGAMLAKMDITKRDEFAAKLDERRKAMIDAVMPTELWRHASASERSFFETPILDVSTQQRINAAWRAESLSCMAWSLSLADTLAPYDTETDPRQVAALVPTNGVGAFLDRAALRSSTEISAARDVAELWHWRSRTRQLREEGRDGSAGGLSSDQIVRMAAEGGASDGILPPPIGYDFPARGKAYRDLSADEWAIVHSITLERHFALNWLCGYAPDNNWDETPTDT